MKTGRMGTILLGAALIVGALVPTSTAPAHAAGLPRCNSGYAMTAENTSRGGSGSYIPSYDVRGKQPTRNCYLAMESHPQRRQEVAEVQYALQDSGFGVSADGYFGPATRAALIKFQRSVGITADGVYGPVTGSRLTWCYWYNKSQHCGRWL